MMINKTYAHEFTSEILQNMPDSEYGLFESMYLYNFIRENKFKHIIEIGTEHKSRSSYIIQKALLKNGGDFKHVMCDLPGVVNDAFNNLFDKKNVEIIPGYIQHTYSDLDLNTCDFLFIDADHTHEFTEWYLKALIKPLKKGVRIHIHDINLYGDWEHEDSRFPLSEAIPIVSHHIKGDLPMSRDVWLWDLHTNDESKWNELLNEYPFIGPFDYQSLPYGCGASYWIR